jgi:hypothetical protein
MAEAMANLIHNHFSLENADEAIPAPNPVAPPPSPVVRRAMVEAHLCNGDYNDSLRKAFIYLEHAVPDPLAFVRRAMEAVVGAPAIRLAASGRGVGVMIFHTKEAPDQAVTASPIGYEHNSISIEPHEEADNRFYAFYSLYAEVAIEDFPLEHWEEERIRMAYAVIGNLCCIDPDCLDGEDFTSVRAVLRLDHLNDVPKKLLIRNHSGPPCICNVRILRTWVSDDPMAVHAGHHADHPFRSSGSRAQCSPDVPPRRRPAYPAACQPSHPHSN